MTIILTPLILIHFSFIFKNHGHANPIKQSGLPFSPKRRAARHWHQQHVGSGGNAAAAHWGQHGGGVGSAVAAAAGQQQRGSGGKGVICVCDSQTGNANCIKLKNSLAYICRFHLSPNQTTGRLPTLTALCHKLNTQHTSHNTQHTTHNSQHTTHNTQHTTHNTQHTTHNTQHTTHNTQHTTHNKQHTTHNTQHTIKQTENTTMAPPARHLPVALILKVIKITIRCAIDLGCHNTAMHFFVLN